MPRRRSFSAEFKTQVVLKLISGEQSAAELCREHRLKPQLLSEWKTAFLERSATVFQSDVRLEEAEVRIADLERQIGRQTMELEAAKKALSISGSALSRSERL